MSWNHGELLIKDIEKLKTIDFDYWLNFSDNTRSLTIVAKKIKQGIQYKDEPNDIFFQIALTQNKLAIEPVILVGENLKKLVILEGHFRLVASLLQEKQYQVIPAIIGLSNKISNWALY